MKLTDETIIKLNALQRDYDNKCFKVINEEAKKNILYKVGNIIQDHFQIGKVIRSITIISVNNRTFEISYLCQRLNKQLKPYRGGEIVTIYSFNVINKL